MATQSYLRVKGAREHNLKNVSVDIPRGKLVVVTGLSGSGKSSLAFDTIFAEGQRRYIESLSAYARQFLGQMKKPDVDSIDGLSPAIAIDQKAANRNPRSTVGTVTEVYDYLRLLFARIGRPHCPKCGRPIVAQTIQQMVDQLLTLPAGTKFMLLAPVISGKKGEYRQLLVDLQRDGYTRVRVDGKLCDLGDDIKMAKTKKHTIEVVVDRLVLRDDLAERLADSLQTALKLAGGVVNVQVVDGALLALSAKHACVHCGLSLPEISPRLFSFNSPYGMCPKCYGIGAPWDFAADAASDIPCDRCHGSRLKREALAVTVGGKNIAEVVEMDIADCDAFFANLALTEREQQIAAQILKEIRARLGFLLYVGLDYLTLGRAAATLSGGEAQRIRLATQIGSGLTGVLYVLDEPSIGLHPRDHARLLDALKRLRDHGNTLLVVEHDEATMRAADAIIDMGPRAGVHGGTVVAKGTAAQLERKEASLTGQYLSGRLAIPVPAVRRPGKGECVEVVGARAHNLKNLDVRFPLGTLTLVTGVSGSGKSTLVNEILYRALAREIYGAKVNPGDHDRMEGIWNLDKVIAVDQAPIGRTPRSNPATYTGLFAPIRELFAATGEAKARGYGPGRFSFNTEGGRCEACQGHGIVKIEMHFLPDVYVPCEICRGARYNRETLEVKYRGLSIGDVLGLTVDEGVEFFANVPSIHRRLRVIQDVGLGYIKLGQSATTLSGGEAQRVKLATELMRRPTGKTLYIMDEPTTGLHFDDVAKLLKILHRIVDNGDTVVVIEHNLEVIKTADWIIDLGPEGGDRGGYLVAEGTPEQVAAVDASHTGQWLRKLLR